MTTGTATAGPTAPGPDEPPVTAERLAAAAAAAVALPSRADRAERAEKAVDRLRTEAVEAVAVTWVDNAGITRVKAVPLGGLVHAAQWGVGTAPCFDVFLADDAITTSAIIGGPTGDLRLYPPPPRRSSSAGFRPRRTCGT
ncbi:hypothetical protein ACIQOV_20755 [Kitasatospora sp. NPDC091257]|uniref:hypothetical protein n=1 Tax=Kitasatospora sp. NPDC091257 TaxID=3364084 RepID=UPI0038064952